MGLRQADDLAARPEHSISGRWGGARLGSTEQRPYKSRTLERRFRHVDDGRLGERFESLTCPPAASMLWSINTRRRPMSHAASSVLPGRNWCSYVPT
jgi:hypothetical protein